MKRWIRLIALFYPRGWREEFGDEFDAVLDDVRPGWRVFANVLKGAVEMRITEERGWMKLVGATAALGALVALSMSFAGPRNYISSAMVTATPLADPVRPESPEARQQRAIERVNEMKAMILSRANLSALINDPSLKLYTKELQTKTILEVMGHMRRDLQIGVILPAKNDSAPVLLSISFLYPDRQKAEATVGKLTNMFLEQNRNMNREQANNYRSFWQHRVQSEHDQPLPPPPVGDVLRVSVVNNPRQPIRLPIALLASGLLSGTLVGLAIRWPRRFGRIVGYAAAGFVLAAGVSFLFPNRFTSTADMILRPSINTESPLGLPQATPTDELGRSIPQALNSQRLAAIIQDPRLNLYSEERGRKPMEDVVKKMRANLQVTATNSGPSSASVLHISFSYSDRFKAQVAVQAVMSSIMELNLRRYVAAKSKTGEVLEVLDTADLPGTPDGPPRFAIALGGLAAGLLLGALKFGQRKVGQAIPPAEFLHLGSHSG